MSDGVGPSSWLMRITTSPGLAIRNARSWLRTGPSATAPSSQKVWQR